MRVTTTTTKEIDITFPAYFLYGNTHYKIVSENKGLSVCHEQGDEEIDMLKHESVIGLIVTSGHPSTPEEFNTALEKALLFFNHINDTL